MNTAHAPASAHDALAMVRAGLSYLAAADPTALTAAEQAGCLRELERADAIGTAARAWILGAFTAAQGYAADADRTPRTWLIHQTHVTEGCAAGHVGWAHRAVAHPLVAAELARGSALTASMARAICEYTDKLPEADRDKADAILLGVAQAGARQEDLARLAAQMYERSRSGAPDEDEGEAFEDRSVALATTFGGAGVLAGNLTAECAAVVRTVLDALSAPAGPEDTRTQAQRYHDALAEALQRLVAAGLLPDRAGAPARVWVHMSLADLRDMDTDSQVEREWTARAAAERAGHRAAASVTGGDGSAWLGGAAARGIACDAILTPVVTGEVDLAALDALIRLCVELDRLDHRAQPPAAAPGSGQAETAPGSGQAETAPGSGQAETAPGSGQPAPAQGPGESTTAPGPDATAAGPDACATAAGPDECATAAGPDECAGAADPDRPAPGPGVSPPGKGPPPPDALARVALIQAILGKAADLLSGPGGLASYLRRGQLGARLAGPSLPLDVGYSDTVPAAIRQAVLLRARGHCEWAGGCRQPASACHVHHVTHKANGGKTSVTGCVLLCPYHHLIVIHRWGWTLVLNPDGTTTARSPDGTKVLHSHGPPPAAPQAA